MTATIETYSATAAEEICRRLSEGESLRAICRTPGIPPRRTVLDWIDQDYCGFRNHYARAREVGYAAMAEELLEISDDGSNDWMKRQSKSGDDETVLDHEHVTRSRLRVDTRKWLLSKMLPKVYGEKLQHTNPDGDGAVVVKVIQFAGDTTPK